MSRRVIVIGGGPVGLTAALLLARYGMRVALVERELRPRRRVRTVALDDESLRVWQACGIADRIASDWDGGAEGEVMCRYLTPGGRTFLGLRQTGGDLGYPQAVAVHEGCIAEALSAAVERHPGIVVHRGETAVSLSQDDDGVEIGLRDEAGHLRHERGSWAIACDGCDSVVRGLLGVDMPGETLESSWLVANVAESTPVLHATIRCDPRRPSVMVSVPHGVRRIECMLEDREADSVRSDEGAARAMLASVWPEAARAEIIERAVLRFDARIARRWGVGRGFGAGAAAAVWPPGAGPGLAAGLRDAANLAFKMAGAAQGWLPTAVLETYERERRPHQERLTRLALRLGRLMTPRSMAAALATQGIVRAATALPFADRMLHLRGRAVRPRYREGFIGAGRLAGDYLPQPKVGTVDGQVRMLDELLGERMTWIALGRGSERGAMQGIPVASGDTVLIENRDFRDPARVLQGTFGRRSVLLVRPDRIVHTHFRPSLAPWRLLRKQPCPAIQFA
ncbi:MAG: FAD-dependent oxidoreductase [bacterium]